jgi:hypothetical protein
MSRFQALTNKVLDAELEMLRKRLELAPNQKADLLREVTTLATWVVRQAERGREIVAQRGSESEPLVHPALERLRNSGARRIGERIELTDLEVNRLAGVLDRGFVAPPALRRALLNLAAPRRRAPKLRWKRPAA